MEDFTLNLDQKIIECRSKILTGIYWPEFGNDVTETSSSFSHQNWIRLRTDDLLNTKKHFFPKNYHAENLLKKKRSWKIPNRREEKKNVFSFQWHFDFAGECESRRISWNPVKERGPIALMYADVENSKAQMIRLEHVLARDG